MACGSQDTHSQTWLQLSPKSQAFHTYGVQGAASGFNNFKVLVITQLLGWCFVGFFVFCNWISNHTVANEQVDGRKQLKSKVLTNSCASKYQPSPPRVNPLMKQAFNPLQFLIKNLPRIL